jgi:hypothetical protein
VLAAWRECLALEEFRREFPEFGIRRDRNDDLRLAGAFTRALRADGFPDIEDTFDLEIVIPRCFPARPPRAYDRGERIPGDYHRLLDKALCLASPLRIALAVRREPALLAFARRFLIPYLYRFSHIDKFGCDPWPDLPHGVPGIIADYSRLLGATSPHLCVEFIALLGKRKRIANKRPCPCGSGHRLGKCHHIRINGVRRACPRSVFSGLHKALANYLASRP